MKLSRIATFIVLVSLSASASSAEGCQQARQVAKSLFEVDHDFFDAAPASIRAPLRPELHAALVAEYARCRAVDEECIDFDPWTGSNALEPKGPPRFRVTSETKTTAEVSVESLLDRGTESALPEHVVVLLERAAPTACWAVSDITLTDSTSLLQLLRTN